MKIWVQYQEENLELLKAIAGGVKNGVYMDSREIGDDATAYVAAATNDQGYHPVVRTNAALGMKKLHDGLAIIIGPKRTKSHPDNKTLWFELGKEKNAVDKGIEKVLAFFKDKKVPSSL